jgi:hypothetical protein
MIGGVVVAAMITSLNAARSTSAHVSDSTDAGLISSFLIRDAQSAGGIDPATAAPDVSLGVSTLQSDPAGVACSAGTLVVRFSWTERTSVASNVVVTYARITDPLDATKQQLIRRICTTRGVNTTKVDVILGRNIQSATAACAPVATNYCAGRPTSVSLTVTGKDTPTALTSILTASLRSAASQLTIIGPPSLPTGQIGAPYPSIFMTTIGSAGTTTWSQTGLPVGLTQSSSPSPTTHLGRRRRGPIRSSSSNLPRRMQTPVP